MLVHVLRCSSRKKLLVKRGVTEKVVCEIVAAKKRMFFGGDFLFYLYFIYDARDIFGTKQKKKYFLVC